MVVLKRMLTDGSAAATAKALGPKFFPKKFLLLEVGDTKPFIHACSECVVMFLGLTIRAKRNNNAFSLYYYVKA